eukprot:gene12613-14803_t
MFENRGLPLLSDLNGFIQQLLASSVVPQEGDKTPPSPDLVEDRNPALLKICFYVEKILSEGIKGQTVMWDFLQNLPKCLPDTARIIELSKDCSRSSVGRGRIFIRLALNEGGLADYLSALLYSQDVVKNPEFSSTFLSLLSSLSHIQFSLVVKDRELDKQSYWEEIALSLFSEEQSVEEMQRNMLAWDVLLDGLTRASRAVLLDFGGKGSHLSNTDRSVDSLYNAIDQILSSDLLPSELRVKAWVYKSLTEGTLPGRIGSSFGRGTLPRELYSDKSIFFNQAYVEQFQMQLSDLLGKVSFALRWDEISAPPKKVVIHTKIIKKKVRKVKIRDSEDSTSSTPSIDCSTPAHDDTPLSRTPPTQEPLATTTTTTTTADPVLETSSLANDETHVHNDTENEALRAVESVSLDSFNETLADLMRRERISPSPVPVTNPIVTKAVPRSSLLSSSEIEHYLSNLVDTEDTKPGSVSSTGQTPGQQPRSQGMDIAANKSRSNSMHSTGSSHSSVGSNRGGNMRKGSFGNPINTTSDPFVTQSYIPSPYLTEALKMVEREKEASSRMSTSVDSFTNYHLIADYVGDDKKPTKEKRNIYAGEDDQLFITREFRKPGITSAYHNQTCPTCGTNLEKLGFLKTRYCYYTGDWFCTNCHRNQKISLPSRILLHWDFKLFPVSDSSKKYIMDNFATPFDIFRFNPEVYKLSSVLSKVLDLRRKLHFIGEYIETCRNKTALESLSTLKEYFITENVHLYSLSDLERCYAGTLAPQIFDVMEKYKQMQSNISSGVTLLTIVLICLVCSCLGLTDLNGSTFIYRPTRGGPVGVKDSTPSIAPPWEYFSKTEEEFYKCDGGKWYKARVERISEGRAAKLSGEVMVEDQGSQMKNVHAMVSSVQRHLNITMTMVASPTPIATATLTLVSVPFKDNAVDPELLKRILSEEDDDVDLDVSHLDLHDILNEDDDDEHDQIEADLYEMIERKETLEQAEERETTLAHTEAKMPMLYHSKNSRRSANGIVVEPQYYTRISDQLASADMRKEVGYPTCFAPSKYICIGTSHGYILVFSHAQDLQSIIGGAICADSGSVTALDLPSCKVNEDWLVSGHQNGQIIVWDIPTGKPLKAIDTRIHKHPILHLKFFSDGNRFIASDAHGVTNVFTITRGIMSFGFEQQLLLNGNLGPVLSIAPLLPGNFPHPTDRSHIVALATKRKILIISASLEGVCILNNKITKPQFIKTSGVLPYLSWRRVSFQKNLGHTKPLEPILAIGWGTNIQLLQIVTQPNDTKFLNPEFIIVAEYQSDNEICGLEWLDSQTILFQNNKDELRVFDPFALEEVESVNIKSMQLIHHSKFQSVYSFHNSIRTLKSHVYLLGMNGLFSAHILTWLERLSILITNGQWFEALGLALDFYEGKAKATTGLSSSTVDSKIITSDKIIEILSQLCHLVFTQDAASPFPSLISASPDLDPRIPTFSQHQQLGLIAIEFCVNVKRTDFLFGEVFNYFVEAQMEGTILELLEPYILSDRLAHLNPEVMQRMMAHYQERSMLERAEQCLLHLDIASLDFHQTVVLCRRHGLYSALIYLYNKGLDDYITPLEDMMEVVVRPHGAAIDEPVAYRLLLYLQYSLSGRAFPAGLIIPTRVPSLKLQVYEYLFLRNIFPEDPTPYPRLFNLLRLDTTAMLRILSNSFDDEFLRAAATAAPMSAPPLAIPPIPFNVNRQNLNHYTMISVLLLIMVDRSQSAFEPQANPDWPFTLQQQGQMFSVLASCHSRQMFARIDPPLMHRMLGMLAAVPLANTPMFTPADRQKALLSLVTSLSPQDYDTERMLVLCEGQEFYLVAQHIYSLSNNYPKMIFCQIKGDAESKHESFEYIRTLLTNRSLPEDARAIIKATTIANLAQLIIIDSSQTAHLIMDHFSNEHEKILKELGAFPKLQYTYLVGFMGNDATLSRGTIMQRTGIVISNDTYELYIKLMCMFSPEKIKQSLNGNEVSKSSVNGITSDEEEQQGSSSRKPKSAIYTKSTTFLNMLVHVILNNMMGHVALPLILTKIVNDHGADEFGDFKSIITTFIEQRARAYSPDSARCLMCNRPLQEFPNSSSQHPSPVDQVIDKEKKKNKKPGQQQQHGDDEGSSSSPSSASVFDPKKAVQDNNENDQRATMIMV